MLDYRLYLSACVHSTYNEYLVSIQGSKGQKSMKFILIIHFHYVKRL